MKLNSQILLVIANMPYFFDACLSLNLMSTPVSTSQMY